MELLTDKVRDLRLPLHVAEAYVYLTRARAKMSAGGEDEYSVKVLLRVDETGGYLGYVPSEDGRTIPSYLEEIEEAMWPLLDE